MARTCIFCRNPVSKGGREHVIPGWIPEHLGQTHLALEHVQRHNVTKREKVPFADYAANIYCGGNSGCNQYFGRTLEGPTKQILTPAIDGERVRYNADEQALLARWAFKTTCALLGAERKRRAVPQADRYRFRKDGTVPMSCFVGIGRYSGGGVRIFAGRLRLIPGRGVATDPIVSVYHSIVAVGQVVFKVFGVLKPPPEDTFRIPVGRLHRVWPPRDDVVEWPPLWSLDDDGIDELALFNPFIRR